MSKATWEELHTIITTKGYTVEAAMLRFSLRMEELIYNPPENEYKVEVCRLIKELCDE